jgi:nucleotide-binding universal stress UspA family protein
MYSPKKILVPTDFSPYADAAVEKAMDLAVQHNAKVFLLHVIEENIKQCAIDYYIDYCLSDDFVIQFENEIRKSSKERLEKQVNTIKGRNKIDIVFDVKKGIPSEIILDEQMRNGVDLIVIASHGKTGLKSYSLGNVANKVVSTAKCPVLVDRAL